MTVPAPLPAHVDVLIVGAGLSGISAAWHLQARCPGRSYAILEARPAMGGTWDLFRYPGIRSDSDKYSFGFRFKPWTGANRLADGPSIKAYIEEAARENGIDRHIRFGHRMVRATWSSADALWTVEVQVGPDRTPATITCRWLEACTGYYDYAAGYTPTWEGTDTFAGQLVHPQHWPEDLDVAGKRVVVIGSGATAVTLIPALAGLGAEVTMLQRSPTYILPLPSRSSLVAAAQAVLPDTAAYTLARWQHILLGVLQYQVSRHAPGLMRRMLHKAAERALGDVDLSHFEPRYNPWDERLCAAPDGDLYRVLREGRAAVVTDHIERFDETGIALQSGTHLDADIVVTATGLTARLLAGIELVVDGEPFEVGKAVSYRGMMYADVPNFSLAFGYINASWTLKSDLIADRVCAILNHMERRERPICVPVRPDAPMTLRPAIGLDAGYIRRASDRLPSQGDRGAWQVHQNYLRDLVSLRWSRVDDGVLAFRKAGATARQEAPPSYSAQSMRRV